MSDQMSTEDGNASERPDLRQEAALQPRTAEQIRVGWSLEKAYERVREELAHQTARAGAAEAKLAEIRDVATDEKYQNPASGREIARNNAERIRRINAILSRAIVNPEATR